MSDTMGRCYEVKRNQMEERPLQAPECALYIRRSWTGRIEDTLAYHSVNHGSQRASRMVRCSAVPLMHVVLNLVKTVLRHRDGA